MTKGILCKHFYDNMIISKTNNDDWERHAIRNNNIYITLVPLISPWLLYFVKLYDFTDADLLYIYMY